MSRRVLALSTALLLIVALAPIASASSGAAESYIVVLKDSVEDPRAVAREHARSENARIGHVYEHALNGYSATMSAVAASRIARDRRVSIVEADGVAHKVGTTQSPATWGLDRIDQADRPLSGSYTYNFTGSGVRAYIIDSGIRVTNPLFQGRAVSGTDTVDPGTDSDDCDGHGTHVAGTVGSSTYGVAKGVTLVGVRVLDCNGSGTWSGVIAGIDWVTGDANGQPAVANMSLGGGYNSSVNSAVEKSTAAGVVYAVAAGNGNSGGKAQDACNYSPASAPSALTTGATSSSDSKASWSNYGKCVDLFAPGVGITSTTMNGDAEAWSGTSMATPHVTGVAALYLEAHPDSTAPAITAAIVDGATPNRISSAGSGSPNLLLYSLLSTGTTIPSDPPNEAPSVTVSSPTNGATVSGASVAVGATASDPDGSVTRVDFYVDAAPTPFASDTSADGGWTATWDSTLVADGSHSITAVAVDDDLATGRASVTVTVSNQVDSPSSDLSLTGARPYKVKGLKKVELTWSGSAAANVDVYRNGSIVATTSNSGTYVDNIDKNGNGRYTYKVCEAGTATCSNELTASFN